MSTNAFFVSRNRVAFVANDNGPPTNGRADVHMVPPQVHVQTRINKDAETIFFIEDGTVEFMIGGAAGLVGAGAYVRIPPNVPFAYRNAGDETARLISRKTRPGTHNVTRLTIDIAAA